MLWAKSEAGNNSYLHFCPILFKFHIVHTDFVFWDNNGRAPHLLIERDIGILYRLMYHPHRERLCDESSLQRFVEYQTSEPQ